MEKSNVPDFETATGTIDYGFTNDYVFRKILQENNDVLKALICSILHMKPDGVEVTVTNPISLGETFSAKNFILEVRVVDKIAEDERRTAFLQHIRQVLDGTLQIGPLAFGLEIKQFTDNIQDVLASFLGRDEFLNPVGKENHTNLIVVLDGRKSKRSGNFRHHILLQLLDGTEIQTVGHVHQQHDRQFTFLLKDFHEWFVEASGHIPVYIAHVVPKLIFADFGERHTPTLEGRMILAGKNIARKSPRLDFNLTDTL